MRLKLAFDENPVISIDNNIQNCYNKNINLIIKLEEKVLLKSKIFLLSVIICIIFPMKLPARTLPTIKIKPNQLFLVQDDDEAWSHFKVVESNDVTQWYHYLYEGQDPLCLSVPGYEPLEEIKLGDPIHRLDCDIDQNTFWKLVPLKGGRTFRIALARDESIYEKLCAMVNQSNKLVLGDCDSDPVITLPISSGSQHCKNPEYIQFCQ